MTDHRKLRRVAQARLPAAEAVRSPLDRASSLSQPLDASLRRRFEPRFGHDFANVRIHADGESDQLTSEAGARAFTSGNDVYFGSDEYAPETAAGQHLIAHELTHVVQNARRSASDLPLLSDSASDAETEASRAADHVVAGRTFTPSVAPAAAVARKATFDEDGIDLQGAVSSFGSPEEKREFLSGQLQAGEFGEKKDRRFGLHASGSVISGSEEGKVGGDAQLLGANADLNAGANGFSVGAGLTGAGIAVRGGDLSQANGEDMRFGVSAGPSFGVRGSWGEEADGHRAYGMGLDLGFASLDLKTKDPVGTLMKHGGTLGQNGLGMGMEGGSALANILGIDAAKPTGENQTDSLLNWARAQRQALDDPSIFD